jgi:hypothetical protein
MAAEIISTVERRRHWPDEEKLRILSVNRRAKLTPDRTAKLMRWTTPAPGSELP